MNKETQTGDQWSTNKDAYIAMVLGAYIRGEENAYERYAQNYSNSMALEECWEKQSDLEYICACAEIDFLDGEDALCYIDLWQQERIRRVSQELLEYAKGVESIGEEQLACMDISIARDYIRTIKALAKDVISKAEGK